MSVVVGMGRRMGSWEWVEDRDPGWEAGLEGFWRRVVLILLLEGRTHVQLVVIDI